MRIGVGNDELPAGTWAPRAPAPPARIATATRSDGNGQLTGSLQLSNRYDVAQFIARSQSADAMPLSQLTDGIHLHTLLCPSEDAFQRSTDLLREQGILLDDSAENC